MRGFQLLSIGVLVGATWCSVVRHVEHEGRQDSSRQGRILFGPRTGFYGDPFLSPGFGLISAIAPLAFVGGLTALALNAFGFLGGGAGSAETASATAASAASPAIEATTEALQQAEDNLNAAAQDEFRKRLEKIKYSGGYSNSHDGLQIARRTTIKPNKLANRGHVTYTSNVHRYEYDFNGKRKYPASRVD